MRKSAVLVLLALLAIVLAVPIASSQELYAGGGGSTYLDSDGGSYSPTSSSTTDSDTDSTSTTWDGGDADNDEGTSDGSTSDGSSTDDSTGDTTSDSDYSGGDADNDEGTSDDSTSDGSDSSTDDSTDDSGNYSGGDADNDEGTSDGTTDDSGNYSGGDADNDEGASDGSTDDQNNETTDDRDSGDGADTGDGTDDTGSGTEDKGDDTDEKPPEDESPGNETEEPPEEPGQSEPPEEPGDTENGGSGGGDSSGGIIDIDFSPEKTEFESLNVYPRELKAGEKVTVEGKLSNFQTRSVEIELDRSRVALTSADADGSFRTSFRVETTGEKTVRVRAGEASRSFRLNVKSEVDIQRISTATSLAPGRTSEVCTEIISDSVASVTLYRNGDRIGDKQTRDEACFDVRFETGGNRLRSVAEVPGDRDELTVNRDLHTGIAQSETEQPRPTGGFFSSVPDIFRSQGGFSNAVIAVMITILVVASILWRY